MTFHSLVRPRRAFAFPFAAVLYPLLWFILRDTGIAMAYGRPNVVPRALGIQALDVVTTPVWLRDVERLLGVVVGWPLLATYLLGFGLSVLFRGSLGVEFAAVAVGVSLSVAWLFVLFGWFVDAITRSVTADTPSNG